MCSYAYGQFSLWNQMSKQVYTLTILLFYAVQKYQLIEFADFSKVCYHIVWSLKLGVANVVYLWLLRVRYVVINNCDKLRSNTWAKIQWRKLYTKFRGG